MVSDVERREVAKNLRNQLGYMRESEGWWYEDDLDVVECGNRAYRNVAGAVERGGNLRDGNYMKTVEKLAELIDRPTCHNEDCSSRSFLCSACGYEAWTYGDSHCDPEDFSFCPNCGRMVEAE